MLVRHHEECAGAFPLSQLGASRGHGSFLNRSSFVDPTRDSPGCRTRGCPRRPSPTKMSQELEVKTFEDLAKLSDIPRTVTTVSIANIKNPITLPQLPAHVETLDLWNITLVGPVHLHEGLKRLSFGRLETETPFIEWIFPSTLDQVEANLRNSKTKIDLRAVTAPTIVLNNVIDQDNGPPLPEGLRTLIMYSGPGSSGFRVAFPRVRKGVSDPDAYRTAEMEADDHARGERRIIRSRPAKKTKIYLLPPYLERLETHMVDYFWTEGELQTSSIKEVVVEAVAEEVNYANLFPAVEKLTIRENPQSVEIRGVQHPTLTELILDNIFVNELDIRTPKIENLTIINGQHGDVYNLLEGNPSEMTLEETDEFPIISAKKPRLQSLTVTKAQPELPLLPELIDLVTDTPQLTKGRSEGGGPVEVSDIFEYKQAWGLFSRVKGAHTVRY